MHLRLKAQGTSPLHPELWGGAARYHYSLSPPTSWPQTSKGINLSTTGPLSLVSSITGRPKTLHSLRTLKTEITY